MKRIIKVAVLTACVGAMHCFARCGNGKANTPEEAFVKMQKSALGGDYATFEAVYLNTSDVKLGKWSECNSQEKECLTELLKNVVEHCQLKDIELGGSKMINEKEAKVFAIWKEKNLTFSFPCKKVDGSWMVAIDDMELVENNKDGSNAKNIAAACVSNMKQIQTAFEQALMAGKTVKTVSDLCGADGYFKVEPECPLGGKYQIGKDFNITCPNGEKGHVLLCGNENCGSEKDGSNDKSIADACVGNMKQIQAAFEQALMAGKTVKTVSDLCGANGYLKTEPKCPLGGKYQIDKDFNITCSSGGKGHVLPR